MTTYTDGTVGVETPYQYTVRALDARQNRSAASNVATVTVPDTVKPTAPANLVAQVAGPARVDLSWTASTDNVGVSNYEIYRNGQLRAVVGNVTTYADTTVNAEVAYQYTVRALDVKQNRSDASNTATVTVPDTVAPTVPGNLVAQAVSGARVDLAWTASTDNVAVAGYEVYRNGVLLAAIGNVTTYADTLVTPLTSYEYTVRAVDAKQNRSAAGNVATATTLAPIATFSPVADAHVEEAKKNNNYGTATTLRTVKGSGKNVFESYLRFDVSGVPGPIKSAKLRLSATTATPDGPGRALRRQHLDGAGYRLVEQARPRPRTRGRQGRDRRGSDRRVRREAARDRQRHGLVRPGLDIGRRRGLRLTRVRDRHAAPAADHRVLAGYWASQKSHWWSAANPSVTTGTGGWSDMNWSPAAVYCGHCGAPAPFGFPACANLVQ